MSENVSVLGEMCIIFILVTNFYFCHSYGSGCEISVEIVLILVMTSEKGPEGLVLLIVHNGFAASNRIWHWFLVPPPEGRKVLIMTTVVSERKDCLQLRTPVRPEP
jgi:hypothetical protein